MSLAHRVDRDDVGVAQLGGGLGLAGEALPDVRLKGELRREDLDGNPPLEPFVAGAVYHAHPAAADFSFDGVGVTQRAGETGRQRLVGRSGHGRDTGQGSSNWPA